MQAADLVLLQVIWSSQYRKDKILGGTNGRNANIASEMNKLTYGGPISDPSEIETKSAWWPITTILRKAYKAMQLFGADIQPVRRKL